MRRPLPLFTLLIATGCSTTPRQAIDRILDTPLWQFGIVPGAILILWVVVAIRDAREAARDQKEQEEQERIRKAPVPPDPEWDAELGRMRDMPDPDD